MNEPKARPKRRPDARICGTDLGTMVVTKAAKRGRIAGAITAITVSTTAFAKGLKDVTKAISLFEQGMKQ